MKELKVDSLLRYKLIQYATALSGTLGILACQMSFGWPSPAIPALLSGDYKIKITSEEGNWIINILLLGNIIGGTTSGFFGEYFGRKKVILFAVFPLLICWIMIGFASEIIVIYVARFLAGLSTGLCFSTVPLYLGEIAEPQIRGMISSLSAVFLVTGLLIINILGSYLDLETVAFVSCSVPILQFLTFVWMPESPHYLFRKGRVEEARRSLHFLRGVENGDKEIERLTNAYQGAKQTNTKVSDLFNKDNRITVLTFLGIRTVQQMAGGIVVVVYCKTIFEEAKDFISPSIGTILYFSVQLVMSIISSFIVDITGRRPLFLISSSGTAISLLSMGSFLYIKNCTTIDVTSLNFVPVVALLCYIVFYSLGLQFMSHLMSGEILPPNIKSMGASFGTIYFCALGIVMSKLFHFTNESYGMHVSFFIFGIPSVFGLVWGYFYLPETKGKTLEDIQRQLKGLPLEDEKHT